MTLARLGKISFWTLAVAAVCAAPAIAQPGGGRGGFGRGGGGGMAGLLQSDQVRQELDITDAQLADLEELRDQMRDEMRSMFQGMRDLSGEERRERMQSMREDMREIQADLEERVGDILMPSQLARLKEINVQQQVRRGGLTGALRGSLAEELGLTDEQQTQLAEKAQQLQADMQEKIAQMRKDAQDELMNLLTPDQRSKLESMMGTDFEMEDNRFGGRQRGQRGQRGGGGRPPADQ